MSYICRELHGFSNKAIFYMASKAMQLSTECVYDYIDPTSIGYSLIMMKASIPLVHSETIALLYL